MMESAGLYQTIYDNNPGQTQSGIPIPNRRNSAHTKAVRTTYEIAIDRCQECRNRNSTREDLCRACRTIYISENLAAINQSGNHEVDAFLLETKLEAKNHQHLGLYNWILHSQFSRIRHIADGGFGSVFRATWYCPTNQLVTIPNTPKQNNIPLLNGQEVALKSLRNSQNITKDFLNEITAHRRCALNKHVIHCFGITRDPATREFMLVMPYSPFGSLHRFLQENKDRLSWEEKIEMLRDIAEGLSDIHAKDVLHGDLHTGNILIFEDPERPDKLKVFICDLGQCRPANSERTLKRSAKRTFYGVLPFVAPELLAGWEYNKDSDIYSFGSIMFEMLVGKTPFSGEQFDVRLALQIYDGRRPQIPEWTPKRYEKLMMMCWHDSPLHRPNAEKVFWTLQQWLADLQIDISQREIQSYRGSYRPRSQSNASSKASITTTSRPFTSRPNSATTTPVWGRSLELFTDLLTCTPFSATTTPNYGLSPNSLRGLSATTPKRYRSPDQVNLMSKCLEFETEFERKSFGIRVDVKRDDGMTYHEEYQTIQNDLVLTSEDLRFFAADNIDKEVNTVQAMESDHEGKEEDTVHGMESDHEDKEDDTVQDMGNDQEGKRDDTVQDCQDDQENKEVEIVQDIASDHEDDEAICDAS